MGIFLLAYLVYYARPVPGVIEWTYGSVVDDQFRLSARLEPGAPGPFLLVASNPTPAALGQRATFLREALWQPCCSGYLSSFGANR